MWFALALLAAVMQASQFAFVKGRARSVPPLVLVLWAQVLGVTGWGLYLTARGIRPVVPPDMWGWIAASVALSSGMSYLLVRGSARGDISIVGPVLALSPIFAIVPDGLLNRSWPSGIGWFGLAFSITGTVSLSRSKGRAFDVLALFRREDALTALGAAILLGLLSATDRFNAIALGIPVYLLVLHVAIALVLGTVLAVRDPAALAASLAPATLPAVLGNALLNVGGTALLISAMTLAPAAYVNAVRRLSAVFSVMLGYVLFSEPGFGGRLAGAVLACAGAACLLLAS